ncbi:hypothetical protein [Pontivivens ytuae]|uniref:Uncharacterized protein n=1 Tax=Pontivivens ytuae TaxID=2789856 RepID=A0A7S9LRE9_9RHOB|nr:hypothetical protein [Pontivivens ytuae]QPH53719.1 hypothetical protein I0K15_18370 [Pontivivens ytuae]
MTERSEQSSGGLSGAEIATLLICGVLGIKLGALMGWAVVGAPGLAAVIGGVAGAGLGLLWSRATRAALARGRR